jgi:signal transduction histidine kinase
MKTHGRYRQLVLFLIALILPSLAVVALGLRTIAQERELSQRRLVEAQQRAVTQVRQDLLARLDRIQLQEISAAEKSRAEGYSDPAVAIVGWADRDHLELPWDLDKSAERFRKSISAGDFSLKIEEAERAERSEKRHDRAAALYNEALKLAVDENQSAHARFLLSDVLETAERRSEAWPVYRSLLALSSEIVDQNGTPFAFYAAQRLLSSASDADRDVLTRLQQESQSLRTLTPAQFYSLITIVRTLEKSSHQDVRRDSAALAMELVAHESYLNQALALQSDFAALRLMPTTWRSYGDEPWLVGMSPAQPDSRSAVIAVRAKDLSRVVATDQSSALGIPFNIEVGGSAGEPLGEGLQGLRVVFGPVRTDAFNGSFSLQRSFYVFSLVLLFTLTLLAGYMMWRDMRRELTIADLRSQFVSSVSHELKTPLTSIRMFAETLRIRKSDERKSAEYLDTIIQESERLTRLLNNVLDFSRIEQGQKSYHLLPTALSDVVSSAARIMEYPLARQGFRLRVSVPEAIPSAYADRDAVEQAILNLLANAMKYSGQSRDIDLQLLAENGSALIRVADRGIGISEKEHAKIFEKFYRAPTPSNQKIPGAGLGLALVAHIVKGHGGSVEVQSAPGEGSTFSIRLPLMTAGNGATR